jgi:hypothetical protein
MVELAPKTENIVSAKCILTKINVLQSVLMLCKQSGHYIFGIFLFFYNC